MSTPTIRTNTHYYPQEELQTMLEFYRGFRCIITNSPSVAVQWSHMLDAALNTSNDQLSEMLRRNLREDRHPRHAGEVRENIVPINSDHHLLMDSHPPMSTIFLHEDILARTLAYEQDLQAWRCAELNAGRPDPGRPTYNDVFGVDQRTLHRYHHGGTTGALLREDEFNNFAVYRSTDCPGIDNPTFTRPFPIIETLLSIPFSLLHTTPRLAALLPLSIYQKELLAMAIEIIHLWWWDPSPQMLQQSVETRHSNLATNNQDDNPNPKPPAIHDSSRTTTTFATKRPTITFGTHTTNFHTHNLNRGKDTAQRDLGPVFLGPQDHWLPDGMLPMDMGEEFLKENTGLIAITGVIDSPLSSEAETEDQNAIYSPAASELETKDNNVIGDITVGDKSTDIALWAAKVVHPEPVPEPLPFTPPSFERGVIASMSVNDILMVKGLISPAVYVDFFDLGSFSRL